MSSHAALNKDFIKQFVLALTILELESCPSKRFPLTARMHYKSIAKAGVKIENHHDLLELKLFHWNVARGILNLSAHGYC